MSSKLYSEIVNYDRNPEKCLKSDIANRVKEMKAAGASEVNYICTYRGSMTFVVKWSN